MGLSEAARSVSWSWRASGVVARKENSLTGVKPSDPSRLDRLTGDSGSREYLRSSEVLEKCAQIGLTTDLKDCSSGPLDEHSAWEAWWLTF